MTTASPLTIANPTVDYRPIPALYRSAMASRADSIDWRCVIGPRCSSPRAPIQHDSPALVVQVAPGVGAVRVPGAAVLVCQGCLVMVMDNGCVMVGSYQERKRG